MPAGLALAFPATFAAGGTAALFVTTAGVTTLSGLGIAVSIGSSVLLATAGTALQKRRSAASADPENVQLNIRQAIGPRIRHYGTVQVGGTIVFFRARSGTFFRVIVHGHGEIDSIESYILDSKEVTVNPADFFVQEGQYEHGGARRVRIASRLGVAPSAHYDQIEGIWPAFDEDHRLDGLWTSLTMAEQVPAEAFRSVYPNGEPSLAIRANTTKLRDPRTGLTVFSKNMALAIADLIEHPDGFNLAGMVDDAVLEVAADDSDDAIPVAAGGTEPRWQIGGSYALTEKPGDVLTRMLDACAGDVQLLPNGKIGVHVGKWRTPDVTLRRDELIEISSWSSGPDKLDRYTELPFTYVDPALDFKATTGDTWEDPAREAANGEIAVGPQQDYSFAPSHGQGRRAAKERIERDNPLHELVAVWRPSARRALFERFIGIDMAELPGTWWRVKGYSLRLSDGAVVLRLASYDESCLAWTSAEEGQPLVLPEGSEAAAIPSPANAAAAGAGVRTAQNSFTAGIAAICDAPASDALALRLEYASAGDDDWQSWPVASERYGATIAPLVDGASYDIRMWFQTVDGNTSAKVTIAGVTARASTTAPAAPTGLAVTNETGGSARVELVTSTSPDLWKTEVYRDAVLIGTFYDDPGEAVVFFDSPGAGTFDWTARSINVSGTENASDAGPITQTIT
ncbi:phage tail protein [Chachezhania sediminis]|uniref:hypothetical protein n=1 Tax=Chachezhania sediminis TaxID=2599291 RepID=UPI00131C11F3|nr:hypothetical protein [Chachezhania sediminis]